MTSEASARIKINRLLENAGWRFSDEGKERANIRLEAQTPITKQQIDAMGENFETVSKGFVDFLLMDDRGFPLVVLEAKSESKDPLWGKEQARTYAKSLNCRFVILSNGNLHYLWDLEHGNPNVITTFPTQASFTESKKTQPNPQAIVDELVEDDYLALSQRPNYKAEAGWRNESERAEFVRANKLAFMRPYQVKAMHAIQRAVANGSDRFLLEMATGTGKTQAAAAIIKLFMRTGNARRVLFLVDRLELEEQARKAFNALLSNDYQTVVYKENKTTWQRAEIVVTTVQSLLFDNKYQRLFSPTDFDLVISDEAHRSIGGNARAVFDYFVGYKLGLTATPRDYLKRFDSENPGTRDPREAERRLLLDTYRTFGCESGDPTFRYSMLDGVREGYLISPTVVDARTDVTTQLLSDDGFAVTYMSEDGAEEDETFKHREFETKFFSHATNELFCKTFLENALRDPISGEVGKSIVFAVSQNHATKLVQIFNQLADVMYPGKYKSDFSIQVTSQIPDAQQYTINFANNNLLGSANFLPSYKTSKARVCVTVGMMTTGYDCPDILNLGLFRPIFSPTDFIQIKGRGTRKHNFLDQLFDESLKDGVQRPNKTTFKLFDFFANCEYFETEFNYDQILKLPRPGAGGREGPPPPPPLDQYQYIGDDALGTIREQAIGYEGMRIDRMFFERFEDAVRADDVIVKAIEAQQWDRVIEYINKEVFAKPDEFYSLEKLRKAAAVDRRLTLREILEKVFGLIPRFKSMDEMLEEEFAKFVVDYKPDEAEAMPAIKNFFKAYVTSDHLRHIIESRHFTDLATNPNFSTPDFKAVPERYRTLIPSYIEDYVPLNQFIA